MTENSYPQEGVVVGDAVNAPYDADEFALLFQASLTGFGRRSNFGVIWGYDNGTNFSLEVTQTTVASSNIEIKIGAGIVQGTIYLNDSTLTKAISANGAGNPRIDTVVVRKDYIAQTIRIAVLQGVAAASPVAPALTQSASIWEIPLADIAVANGFSTLSDLTITPRHQFVNVGEGTYSDGILNNSGVTLTDGDVVIWDYSTAKAVTTTTTSNHWKVAGVWRGITANGGYGRIQTRGFGKVKVSFLNGTGSTQAGLTPGIMLVTGYTARFATPDTVRGSVGGANLYRGTDIGTVASGRTGSAPAQLGFLMQASGSIAGSATFSGLLLAYIDVQKRANPHTTLLQYAQSADFGTFTSGSWVTRGFTRVSHGDTIVQALTVNNLANNYVALNGGFDTVTLQPGRYRLRGWSAGYRVDGHLVRLQNTSGGTTIIVGQSAYSPSAADSSQTYSEFDTFLVIEAVTSYQLQARCTTTRATDGGGKYISFGGGELDVYTQLEITRLDEVYA